MPGGHLHTKAYDETKSERQVSVSRRGEKVVGKTLTWTCHKRQDKIGGNNEFKDKKKTLFVGGGTNPEERSSGEDQEKTKVEKRDPSSMVTRTGGEF